MKDVSVTKCINIWINFFLNINAGFITQGCITQDCLLVMAEKQKEALDKGELSGGTANEPIKSFQLH